MVAISSCCSCFFCNPMLAFATSLHFLWPCLRGSIPWQTVSIFRFEVGRWEMEGCPSVGLLPRFFFFPRCLCFSWQWSGALHTMQQLHDGQLPPLCVLLFQHLFGIWRSYEGDIGEDEKSKNFCRNQKIFHLSIWACTSLPKELPFWS